MLVRWPSGAVAEVIKHDGAWFYVTNGGDKVVMGKDGVDLIESGKVVVLLDSPCPHDSPPPPRRRDTPARKPSRRYLTPAQRVRLFYQGKACAICGLKDAWHTKSGLPVTLYCESSAQDHPRRVMGLACFPCAQRMKRVRSNLKRVNTAREDRRREPGSPGPGNRAAGGEPPRRLEGSQEG